MIEAKRTERILGLDIGANSLGWALIEAPVNNLDIPSRIIRTGARIFQAGVDKFDSPKEESKNENRRVKRGTRRRIRRLAQRKRQLRELLCSRGILPPNLELDTSDPYELRSKGLDEKLTLKEFGRVLYHMAQRRGFNTARKTKIAKIKTKKTASNDVVDEAKTQNGQKEEKKESILASISELEEQIQKSEKETLGAYLYALRKENPNVRIRKRHTRRSMYEEEFERLWTKQSKFYPMLTDELHDQIKEIIFYQRNIYWKRSSIGECELEPGEKRLFRADRLAQEFRLLQEVNNLKYLDSKTNEIVRVADHKNYSTLIDVMKSCREISFDKVREILGIGPYIRFNLETGKSSSGCKRSPKNASESAAETGAKESVPSRTKLKGMETDYVLKNQKYFGKIWDKKSDEERNEIVRILIERADKDGKYIDEKDLRKFILAHWGVSEDSADNLLDVADDLPQGRLRFSQKAIAKLLPYMREGRLFMGDSDNDALHQAGYTRPDERPWTRIDFLPPLELASLDAKKIVDPKRKEAVDAIRKFPAITNPVVRRCVNEVRRLVNAVIREYGRPDRFCVELAREAKANSEQRKAMARNNRLNQEENQKADVVIRECGKRPTFDNRLRYRLWKEQNETCPYTSKPISLDQLFSSEIDVDHIIPQAQGGEDSRINRVVCFRKANAKKRDRTPKQWLANANPEQYEAVLAAVQRLPYAKRLRFSQNEGDVDKFVARQLNDTKYASRYVKQYLQLLFDQDKTVRVFCLRGNQTATLRHFWGLNSILHYDPPLNLQPNEKNRADHRHHAVDALVIATTTPKILQSLANNQKPLPAGWETLEQFRKDASESIYQIVVSHEPIRRVRGSLCDDTYYGPVRVREDKAKGNLVRRKPLCDLTASEVPQIRDKTIRAKLLDYLDKKHGIRLNKTGTKLNCSKKALQNALASKFYLHPEEQRTEIKKVRILISNKTAEPLHSERGGAPLIIPGNTSHVRIFEWIEKNKKGEDKLCREAFFTTQMEANRRNVEKYRFIKEETKKLPSCLAESERRERVKKIRRLAEQRYPVIDHCLTSEESKGRDARFVMSFSLNETLEITDIDIDKLPDDSEPKRTLVLFKTGAATSKQLYFSDIRSAFKKTKKNDDASETENKEGVATEGSGQEKESPQNKAVERFSASPKRIYRKVFVDILGNIHPAGD